MVRREPANSRGTRSTRRECTDKALVKRWGINLTAILMGQGVSLLRMHSRIRVPLIGFGSGSQSRGSLVGNESLVQRLWQFAAGVVGGVSIEKQDDTSGRQVRRGSLCSGRRLLFQSVNGRLCFSPSDLDILVPAL